MVRLFEVSPIIWETVTEELEKKLSDIEFKAKDITPDWRKLAHRRKIDREIFEKYGYFKDIILHPKFQLVKHYYEEHADFNLFVGEPLLPLTTAIILLFILYRKVNANILILIASSLFNINPFYVSLVVFLSWFSVKRKKVPKQYKTVKPVTVASSVPNGSVPSIEQFPFHLTSNDKEYSEFDHIFIGRNISTLYAAALLSKNGHRVCVLELPQSPKSTILPSGAPCAADIEQITVNKLERYQFLLDCVQSRKNPRVQFTPIGRAETGFTHSIITLKHPTQRQKDQTLALRYGPENIAHEVSSIYPINRSTVSAVFQKIRATMGLISNYLYSHVLTNKGDDASRGIRAEYEKDSNFQTINEFVRSSVEKTLYDNQLEQADVINALTGLASTIGCQESCLKNTISSLALGGLINTETGTFVPRHGVSELEAALTHVIYESGGKVFSANQVKGLEIEESAKKDGSSHSSYKVIGVTITNNGKSKGDCLLKANHSVVSGIGLLGSYATLVPSECVSDETKEQLSLLQEKRPKIKVILWLKGEAAELGVTSVNYFEILSSLESVGAGLNTQCGKEHDAAEKLAGSYVHIWSPLAQNPDLTNRNTQIVVVEFEATEPVVRSEVFNWQAESSNVPKGPKFYVSKRDEATNPNHPDYGLTVGGRVLALTGSQKADYQRRAELLLHSLYPRTFGNIIFSHVEEPTLGGYALSNNTAKFASSLSLKTEIENFYLTGEDFAFNGYMGALQGGWLTANAVLGYSVQELSAGKNLFVDLYSLSS